MAKKSLKVTGKNKTEQSVREQAAAERNRAVKPRKLTSATKKARKPLHKARTLAKREYYIPLPDNKAGAFLNKPRKLLPGYFRESWDELKQVAWPDRRTTVKLTTAVLIFAVVFGVLIAIVDWGLDKVFRSLLLQ